MQIASLSLILQQRNQCDNVQRIHHGHDVIVQRVDYVEAEPGDQHDEEEAQVGHEPVDERR